MGGFGVLSKWLPVKEYEVSSTVLLPHLYCRVARYMSTMPGKTCDSSRGFENMEQLVIETPMVLSVQVDIGWSVRFVFISLCHFMLLRSQAHPTSHAFAVGVVKD